MHKPRLILANELTCTDTVDDCTVTVSCVANGRWKQERVSGNATDAGGSRTCRLTVSAPRTALPRGSPGAGAPVSYPSLPACGELLPRQIVALRESPQGRKVHRPESSCSLPTPCGNSRQTVFQPRSSLSPNHSPRGLSKPGGPHIACSICCFA